MVLTLKDQFKTGKGFKMNDFLHTDLGQYSITEILNQAKAEQDRRKAAGIAPVLNDTENQLIRSLADSILATKKAEESILRKSIAS